MTTTCTCPKPRTDPQEPCDWCRWGHEPVHGWFGLTYANYAVQKRSILQSMPYEWQLRWVRLMEELHEAAADIQHDLSYRVHLVDDRGRFVEDPIPHYERGRTRLPLRSVPIRPDLDRIISELRSERSGLQGQVNRLQISRQNMADHRAAERETGTRYLANRVWRAVVDALDEAAGCGRPQG